MEEVDRYLKEHNIDLTLFNTNQEKINFANRLHMNLAAISTKQKNEEQLWRNGGPVSPRA